jgi:hypothetical protein
MEDIWGEETRYRIKRKKDRVREGRRERQEEGGKWRKLDRNSSVIGLYSFNVAWKKHSPTPKQEFTNKSMQSLDRITFLFSICN